jgi:hypothetical protein
MLLHFSSYGNSLTPHLELTRNWLRNKQRTGSRIELAANIPRFDWYSLRVDPHRNLRLYCWNVFTESLHSNGRGADRIGTSLVTPSQRIHWSASCCPAMSNKHSYFHCCVRFNVFAESLPRNALAMNVTLCSYRHCDWLMRRQRSLSTLYRIYGFQVNSELELATGPNLSRWQKNVIVFQSWIIYYPVIGRFMADGINKDFHNKQRKIRKYMHRVTILILDIILFNCLDNCNAYWKRLSGMKRVFHFLRILRSHFMTRVTRVQTRRWESNL